MSSIKIVIVDDNEEFCNGAVAALKECEKFSICGIAHDGEEGLKIIRSTKPDVVLLDLIMPKLDGYAVLAELEKESSANKPVLCVISALTHDKFVERAMMLGADYYMAKPISKQALYTAIEKLVEEKNKTVVVPFLSHVKVVEDSKEKAREAANKTRTKAIDEKLSNIFITVGIPAHIKGYQFLREAIKLAIDKPDIINSITKKLYPFVAEKFDTSSSKVERAIRHAIEVAWNRGKIENINNLFGLRVYGKHEKPTNGEFIALLADKLLIEGA